MIELFFFSKTTNDNGMQLQYGSWACKRSMCVNYLKNPLKTFPFFCRIVIFSWLTFVNMRIKLKNKKKSDKVYLATIILHQITFLMIPKTFFLVLNFLKKIPKNSQVK